MKSVAVFFALVLVLTFVSAGEGAPEAVQLEFGDKGLRSLKCGGVEFLESGELHAEQISFRDEKREVTSPELKPPQVNVDRAAGTVTQTWEWGRIESTYASAGNRCDIVIRISNSGMRAISALSLCVLTLKFPETPVGFGAIPCVAN